MKPVTNLSEHLDAPRFRRSRESLRSAKPQCEGNRHDNISRLESQLESRLESKLAARALLQLRDQPSGNAELIEMTIPDKPQSRLQRYRVTENGRSLLNQKGRQSI